MSALAQQAEPAGDAAGLDGDRLSAFLAKSFPHGGTDLVVEPTVGGMSNPTFFVTYGGRHMVLRKQPGSVLAKSAHAIDREFRVMTALRGSAVPVPEPILYHAEADVLDTPFYLMERIEGRVITTYAMPGLSPEERRRSYDAMARALAAIHRFDWAAASLSDYGRPGNYFSRQLSRWSQQWEQFRTDDNPYLDPVIAWLSARVPPSETLVLCHGDFRIGNLMFGAHEPAVVGVLDWELSTLGHPLVDLAFNTQAWQMAPDENGGLQGLPIAELGIPSEDEYLESYYRYAGSAERMETFHKVFAMFRGAVGSAGVAARGRAGNASFAEAATVGGKLAVAYAKRGLELIERA